MSKRYVAPEVNQGLNITLPTDMLTVVRRCFSMQHAQTISEFEMISRSTKIDEFVLFARHMLIESLASMYKGYEADALKTGVEFAKKSFARGQFKTIADAYAYAGITADGKRLLTDQEVLDAKAATNADAAKK